MTGRMTSHALRAIAFSYCDMRVGDFQNLMRQMEGEIDDTDEVNALEQDQTLLAMIALKDPLRQNIKEIIKNADESNINLRLISGDNLNTTAAVAFDVGLLTREEYESI